MLAFLSMLVFVGMVLALIIGVITAHRANQAAADLAALAAASALGHGADGCGAAAATAAANGSHLTSCTVKGREVRIVVGRAGPAWWSVTGAVEAEARAGPG